VPRPSGCRNCRCEPRCLTSKNPKLLRIRSTSRGFRTGILLMPPVLESSACRYIPTPVRARRLPKASPRLLPNSGSVRRVWRPANAPPQTQGYSLHKPSYPGTVQRRRCMSLWHRKATLYCEYVNECGAHTQRRHYDFFKNALNKSIGNGKNVVVLCSLAISRIVCRYRNCNAIGSFAIIAAACTIFSAA